LTKSSIRFDFQSSIDTRESRGPIDQRAKPLREPKSVRPEIGEITCASRGPNDQSAKPLREPKSGRPKSETTCTSEGPIDLFARIAAPTGVHLSDGLVAAFERRGPLDRRARREFRPPRSLATALHDPCTCVTAHSMCGRRSAHTTVETRKSPEYQELVPSHTFDPVSNKVHGCWIGHWLSAPM
jgi:hypothetical protein